MLVECARREQAYDELRPTPPRGGVGPEVMRELERRVVLSVLDRKWREHLYEMDYLQEGIGLRAMAQRDPLVEYQREGFLLFEAMNEAIKEESIGYLFNVEVTVEEAPPPPPLPPDAPEAGGDPGRTPARVGGAPGGAPAAGEAVAASPPVGEENRRPGPGPATPVRAAGGRGRRPRRPPSRGRGGGGRGKGGGGGGGGGLPRGVRPSEPAGQPAVQRADGRWRLRRAPVDRPDVTDRCR